MSEIDTSIPIGYAEKTSDTPEWLQGSIALHYFGISDRNKTLFDHGLIAIEWHVSSNSKWWRYCARREAL